MLRHIIAKHLTANELKLSMPGIYKYMDRLLTKPNADIQKIRNEQHKNRSSGAIHLIKKYFRSLCYTLHAFWRVQQFIFKA